MKKIIFTIIFGMFLISLVSASLPHKQNTDLFFSITSNNATECVLTTINTPLQVTLINQTGTQVSQTFNFTIDGNNFTELGTYQMNLECSDGSSIVSGAVEREVTYLGKKLDSGKALMSLGFLALLILIFFLNFVGMGFLPKRNQTDEDGRILSITYLKYFRNVLFMTGYFLFIGITYIASNLAFGFLDEVLIANTLFMIFRVSFGLAPLVVIVWLVWIFVSMFHDKQFQKMLNRGIFPGGNL